LPVALGAVGLHGAAAASGHGAEAFEHRVGAGGYETRRYDRPDQAAIAGEALHVLDEGACPVEAGGGRFAVVIGTLIRIVRSNLADEGPLALGEADVGEKPGRILMDGAEIDGGGGSAGDE